MKRSNLANITTAEAPVEHVMEAAEGDWWFQLRGACTTNHLVEQSPVAGCYHLGFFDGAVDTATGTVSMVLPCEATDGIGRLVAGTFQRGRPISENQSAGVSITASAQAVVSNPSSTLLDTPGDGSFAGELTGAGTHLWVKPCIVGSHVIGRSPSHQHIRRAPCVEA